MESVKYFLNMGFVLINVVGIDEDVVQIYDDYDLSVWDSVDKDQSCGESLFKCFKS